MKRVTSVGIMFLLVGLLACAPAPGPTPSTAPLPSPPPSPVAQPAAPAVPEDAAWAKTVDAARREGKVIVYSTFASLDWRRAFGELMKNKYGITVEWLFGTGAANAEKIRIEHEARSVVGDIYHAGPIPFIPLKAKGYLIPFDPPEVKKAGADAWDLVPTAYEPDKVVLAVALSAGSSSPWVNTTLVKPERYPKTYQDLLDPRWKGKMNNLDPTFGGSGSRTFYWLSGVYGLEYWQKMAQQNITFVRTYIDVVNRLAAGEDALALGVNLPYVIDTLKAKAPIEPVFMKEGVPAPTIAMSLTAGAPHPNAAKVFINLALSEEGQATMSLIGHRPIRRGAKGEWPHPFIVKLMDHRPMVTFDLASDVAHNKQLEENVAAKIFRLGEFAR